MLKLYDILELPVVIDWNKYSTMAVIGKGSEANKYTFNPERVMVFGINDSIIFYPKMNWSIVTEIHFSKIFSSVNSLNLKNLVYMSKKFIRTGKVVHGCTPSLFLGAVMGMKIPIKKIYLQGFSMDGVSPRNDTYPYNWFEQERAFRSVFDIAKFMNIDMSFVSLCTRMGGYKRSEPDREDII